MSSPPRNIPKLSELDLVIETGRLRLRPFQDSDVEELWPIVSQPELSKLMSWSAHRDREETREYVRATRASLAAGTSVAWAIEHDKRIAGCVGLHDIVWQYNAMRLDVAELGYWMAPALWGKGMMTEAATAVVRFAFDTIGLHKVTTHCFAENHGSRRVIEKVGFRFVGRVEEDAWKDGTWHTGLAFELTAPEWPDVHTTMRVSRPRPT